MLVLRIVSVDCEVKSSEVEVDTYLYQGQHAVSAFATATGKLDLKRLHRTRRFDICLAQSLEATPRGRGRKRRTYSL